MYCQGEEHLLKRMKYQVLDRVMDETEGNELSPMEKVERLGIAYDKESRLYTCELYKFSRGEGISTNSECSE